MMMDVEDLHSVSLKRKGFTNELRVCSRSGISQLSSVKPGFRFTPNRMAPAWGPGSDCTRPSYRRIGPEGFCQRAARSEQSLQPILSDHLFRNGSQMAVRDQPCRDSPQ